MKLRRLTQDGKTREAIFDGQYLLPRHWWVKIPSYAISSMVSCLVERELGSLRKATIAYCVIRPRLEPGGFLAAQLPRIRLIKLL